MSDCLLPLRRWGQNVKADGHFQLLGIPSMTRAISLQSGAKALRIVRAYGIGAVAYLAIAVAVDFFKPQRVLAVGAPWCLDDWCLQVESVSRATDGPRVTYDIKLRIFSTTRGITQRANGAWLYLIDERGHRYAANSDPSAMPLTVQLGPGLSSLPQSLQLSGLARDDITAIDISHC